MYQINAAYRINKDSMNWILQKKSTSKGGLDRWANIAYYTSVKDLYHGLVERGIKEASLRDIEELHRKVEELHELIDKMPIKAASILSIR